MLCFTFFLQIVPFMLLLKRFFQNCVAAFGRCEHEKVLYGKMAIKTQPLIFYQIFFSKLMINSKITLKNVSKVEKTLVRRAEDG